MRRRNTMVAVLFLLALGLGFLLIVTAALQGEGQLYTEVGKLRQDIRYLPEFLTKAESAANGDLDRNHYFIQIYGGVQRLTGRRVVEDTIPSNTVAKLSTGALNFVNFTQQKRIDSHVADNTADAVALAERLGADGIPYLYVQAPQKIQRGTKQVPTGLREFGNDVADELIDGITAAGVEVVDLRTFFEESNDYADWFFRTDHHWKPEAAFAAWNYLLKEFETRYSWSWYDVITDEVNYDKKVLEDFFLGSQGKRVGSLYAGADDFTLYVPRFYTDLTYTAPFYQIDRTGSFQDSVCFPERVETRDWFGGNPYTYYGGGDYPLAKAVNHLNPEGPSVVLIRDSFACAITPFLALSCGELTTIDLRYYHGDPYEAILAAKPDLVMTLYAPGTTEKQDMFSMKVRS